LTLNVHEFNAKCQPVRESDGAMAVKLPDLVLMYDFAVTKRYTVFVQPPLKVNSMQYLLSGEPGKSVEVEGAPSARA
jgi:carotenoid cleavage dioxygenase-like enzyme